MMSDAVRFYQALSDMPTRDYPIRDAFQTFYHEYAASHFVSTEQSKAARCICECKTGSLGYNIGFCEKCGHVEIHAWDSTVAAAPITIYAPSHKTAKEYREVARELIANDIVA